MSRRNEIPVVMLALLAAGCGWRDEERAFVPATDWVHERVETYDSTAGRFTSAALGRSIEYDIGDLAGHFVEDADRDVAIWYRTGRVRGSFYRAALVPRGDGCLLAVTFPEPLFAPSMFDKPVNVFATVYTEDEAEVLFPHLLERARGLLPK